MPLLIAGTVLEVTQETFMAKDPSDPSGERRVQRAQTKVAFLVEKAKIQRVTVADDFQGGAPTEGEEHVYEVELSTFTGRYGPAYVLTAKRDVTDRLGALIPA